MICALRAVAYEAGIPRFESSAGVCSVALWTSVVRGGDGHRANHQCPTPGRMAVDRSTAHHGYFQCTGCDSTWCRHPSSCLRARDTVVGIDLFKTQAIAAMLQGRKHRTIFLSPVTLGSAIHFQDLKYKASSLGIHLPPQAILDLHRLRTESYQHRGRH